MFLMLYYAKYQVRKMVPYKFMTSVRELAFTTILGIIDKINIAICIPIKYPYYINIHTNSNIYLQIYKTFLYIVLGLKCIHG